MIFYTLLTNNLQSNNFLAKVEHNNNNHNIIMSLNLSFFN